MHDEEYDILFLIIILFVIIISATIVIGYNIKPDISKVKTFVTVHLKYVKEDDED